MHAGYRGWDPPLHDRAGRHLQGRPPVSVVAHEGSGRRRHEENGRQTGHKPGTPSPGPSTVRPARGSAGAHLDWQGKEKLVIYII